MKKKISLVFASVLAVFYVFFLRITFDTSKLENLNNGEVVVIGHAGLGFESWIPFNPYPDNGILSLTKAIVEEGADGVEVDVHMTKDGEFVLYHDVRLDSKTDLSGCIADMNIDEVLKAKYRLGFPFDWFHNDNLTSLDNLVELLKEQEEMPYLHLDIRSTSECKTDKENGLWEKKMANRLIEKLQVLGIPKEKILVITISRGFAQALHRLDNPFPTSFELIFGNEDEIAFAKKNGINSVTVKPRLLTKEGSKALHDQGFQVITFGAKSKSGNKKLLEGNPDIIQTNNISALKDLLSKDQY